MSKLDKRAISTLVIAILSLSFALPLVSVSASPDVEVVETGGLSEWTTEKVKVGIYSLNVTLPSVTAAVGLDVKAWFTESITLADLTEAEFWEYVEVPGGTWELGAAICLYFDMDEVSPKDGVYNFADDVQLIFEAPYNSPNVTDHIDEWVLRDLTDETHGFHGWAKGGGKLSIGPEGSILTLADWNATAYSTEDVIGVGLILGWGNYGDYVGYLDDITVNGVTYPLEIDVPEGEDFSIDYVTPGDVDYGDVLTVIGSGVTAGSEVKIFWDYAFGTYAHLLNTTEGNPDSTFDCEVTVPSDIVGAHYLWATDVATGATISHGPITMVSKIKLSPSSGLVGDEIAVKGYGFADESDVTVTFDGDVLTTTVETDELGYFTYKFDVPTGTLYGEYDVTATDSDLPQNLDSEIFIVGASISLTPEEGPTGTVVTVSGRGWTVGNTITFREETSLMAIEVMDRDVITVGSGGTFSADVVIPALGAEGDYNIEALESITLDVSSDKFELNGLPEVEISPVYGTPGASITVTGSNFTQISGVEVTVTINTSPTMELVIAETNSDGTFEDTFMSPAVEFKGYTITAEDEYFIDETDSFKVGLIALIINPVYGEAGTKISITGIGFAPLSSYNVTFGTILYENYGTVSGGEAISDTFFVPNVEVGTYDMTIVDEDENELTVQFSVTAVTEIDLDPAMAPNTYNVTIEGYNFADYVYDVDLVLYNATDTWDMDVWNDGAGDDPVETDDDGNFTAWWEVLPEADLSLGDYTINVTGYDDFLLQVNFSVVEARVSVAPRKALFDRGDTIQFNVNNDFDQSYMKVWDPYDNLYWQTELFVDWVKSGDLYTVPYYLQTSGMNPMTLAQDAPMGTWLWIFYETGTTELVNGTFEVGPSSAAQVDEKLTELWGSVEELTTNIDDITSEIEDDIDALSGEIDDVVADVQDMVDDITADLAGELAQVAQDTEAAVGELEDSIGDIASAQNELASDLDAVSQDTTAAREAAEDAQTAASGLTTLVYGAIGASLIAALAAIVSLMQISKKIA